MGQLVISDLISGVQGSTACVDYNIAPMANTETCFSAKEIVDRMRTSVFSQ